MPSRHLLQDLQDLPDLIDSHYKEVTKEIIEFKNKFFEISQLVATTLSKLSPIILQKGF